LKTSSASRIEFTRSDRAELVPALFDQGLQLRFQVRRRVGVERIVTDLHTFDPHQAEPFHELVSGSPDPTDLGFDALHFGVLQMELELHRGDPRSRGGEVLSRSHRGVRNEVFGKYHGSSGFVSARQNL
jgi:hypothetical protein